MEGKASDACTFWLMKALKSLSHDTLRSKATKHYQDYMAVEWVQNWSEKHT